MKAGAVTVAGGVIVIATVAALYFWPTSVGDDCPPLPMTVDQASTTFNRDVLLNAMQAVADRDTCLTGELTSLSATSFDGALGGAELLARGPFMSDDLRRWRELAAETNQLSDVIFERLQAIQMRPAVEQAERVN